jgi:hypothetical protein
VTGGLRSFIICDKMALDLTTSSLRRTTTTTTLNQNHTDVFVMNDLVSDRYETTPIQGKQSRIPGYAGHIPGNVEHCYSQRRAQASLHTNTLSPLIIASKGKWQDMQLVDLRPGVLKSIFCLSICLRTYYPMSVVKYLPNSNTLSADDLKLVRCAGAFLQQKLHVCWEQEELLHGVPNSEDIWSQEIVNISPNITGFWTQNARLFQALEEYGEVLIV